MKPIQLEIQAFGPFAERQTVDFEKLARGGIFLIKGKTGSGKTTIFDAMTFALYGGSSGSGDKVKTGRNDFEEWRCNQAPADMPTEVSYIFSVRDRVYYFRRFLVPSRRSEKLSPKYEAGELDEAGNETPFFNNPKEKELNAKAEELIGLTRDQFRQVVLLPQGQFERFLTASSGEKEDILKTIFNSERWEKYAQKFYNAAAEHKKDLDDEGKWIINSLAEEKTEGGDPMTEPTQLEPLIHSLEEIRKQEEIKHLAYDGEKKQDALNADLRLAEQFQPLHRMEKKSEELKAKKAAVQEKRSRYEAAETAESFRTLITEYEAAEREYTTRTKTLEKECLALPEKEQAAQTAEKMFLEQEKASPVPALQQKIGEYEAKKPFYEQLSSAQQKYNAAAAAKKEAESALSEASDVLRAATEKASASLHASGKAEETAREYRNRYYAGIYGELAAELTEGGKCPVCGSEHHPSPAARMPDSVSKEAMEAKEKLAENAKKQWNEDEQERTKASEQREKAQAEYDLCMSGYLTAEAALKAAKSSLIEGIPDAEALKEKTNELAEKIKAFNRKLEDLKKKQESAANALQEQRTQIASAEKEKKDAEEKKTTAGAALDDALREKGCTDYREIKKQLLAQDLRGALHAEIVSYETDCRNTEEELQSKRAELAGKTEPDSSRFEDRQAKIREEAENYSKRDTELSKEIERLKKKQEDLTGKWMHYHEEIGQAESDLAFAKKLRGDTGFGLQRYVLAVMFNQIIGEANQMLAKVHGGRYKLFRSDKGAGRKTGLELSVHDSRCPEQEGRSVAMLSGGEKFLVSLALSIGMSTVAQKSGVQIDALFIDEGFGTLDDSSISDAMDVLETVRRSNSTIGIISHVQLLEDALQTQLEVVKTEKGNYIRMA